MSVPHLSGAGDQRTESPKEATLVDDTPAKTSGATPNQTVAEQSERDEVTIVDRSIRSGTARSGSNEADDRDATITEGAPVFQQSESAVQTVIDPKAQDACLASPEFQTSADSSSAARDWAPTKGATEAAWPQPSPSVAKKPQTSQRPQLEDRYQLLDNFARGGLGNIWRAKDSIIHREIAFKELLPKALKNPRIVERFLEEAQITGQLEHPGIVPIYDVGYQENGTPFYAMKLLKGGNMEEAIETLHILPRGSTERQLAFTRLLRQFIAVCQAVGFAHEKGVLHRDLKPLNVMIGQFGETMVLDWGLAKVVDALGEHEIATDSDGQLDNAKPSADDHTLAESPLSDTNVATTKAGATGTAPSNIGATRAAATSAADPQTARTEPGTFFRRQVTTDARTAGSQTMMGQIMGTPAYMPPEQARGLINELDARTDIYSLGGILYKLLTNQSPVAKGKAQDVLAKVISGQIVRPREIDSTIPAPLEAICRKAMALLQADRYQRALDLAADVESWLADEPVSVFPEPWHERFRRWRKRHRALVFGSTVAAVVVLCGSIAWIWLESSRVESLRLAAQSKVDAAGIAAKDSDLAKATTLLREALGQVQAESKLTQLRETIQGNLDYVGRLQAAAEQARLAELRTKTSRLLEEAQQATNTARDFAHARTLLTEAVTLLAKETSLAELHRQAQSLLADVNQSLAEQSEVDAAKAQLAKFMATVEQVRVHGSNLSGQDSTDDLREARKLGLAGLELFAIDFKQTEKLDPRLTLIGPDAIETWRSGAFELLFTVAQVEINLANRDQPAEFQRAAQRSLDRLQEADHLGRTSPVVAALKAQLLESLGKTEEAQAALKEMATIPARTRFDHFFLGEMDRLRHDYKSALSHYQDALQVAPDDFWSLNMIGYCHLYSQDTAAATAAYTACIARRPKVFWPYVVRGYAFGELKQYEKAQRDFDKALELEPQSYHVFLNRGVVFLKKKDYAAARADFVKAGELRPDLAGPHENLADLSRLLGRELAISDAPDGVIRANAEFQTSLAELTKAISLSPQQASLYHARGMIRVALSDATAAIDDFRRAIRQSPNPRLRAASLREIGLIHQRAKRFPEALSAFDQSWTQNPQDTNVIRQRAETLLSLNRFAEAVAGFTEFLEKEGPVGDVYRARGLAFAKMEKYREAINDYTMSLQYEPSPNMLKQRGKAYLLQATQLAKEDFEESLRLNPIDPDSRWGLAHAMVLLGDYAGAVVEVEKTGIAAKGTGGQFGPREWPLLFNPATTYALAYAKALVDPKLSGERREELTKQYVSNAVELLDLARRTAGEQFGQTFVKQLRSDTDLNPIRQRPEFTEFLKKVDAVSQPK